MRIPALVAAFIGACSLLLAAQEQERKPVPKDSVRVSVPGCTRGQMFTAGQRTTEEPGSVEIPEGMHLRMNGNRKMMGEIRAHEGSMIEITGLMKKGQVVEGVNLGGGVRISPGPAGPPGTSIPSPTGSQIQIDVESWRPIDGSCRT
jgi:hypothetical protein